MRTEGKLIHLLEHLEQQTITKIQFQKSQISLTKIASPPLVERSALSKGLLRRGAGYILF